MHPHCKKNLLLFLFLGISFKSFSSGQASVQNFSISRPFAFEENKGQLADLDGKLLPGILYSGKSKGVHVYCYKDKIAFVFEKKDIYHKKNAGTGFSSFRIRDKYRLDDSVTVSAARMEMQLLNADKNIQLSADEQQHSYSTYYLAHCPNGLKVNSYNRLTYHNIYPHIDMILTVTGNGLEYSFVVHPGGDVKNIQLQWLGADSIAQDILAGSSIHYACSLGRLEESGLAAQLASGQKITCHYRIDSNKISFDAQAYNKNKILIIDPKLVWATYYGGTNDDYGIGITTDTAGNILIGGYAGSTSGIATSGAFQTSFATGRGDEAFIAKFSSNGKNLQWGTYFGIGSATAVAAGNNDNVYVTGYTAGSGLATSGAYQTSYGGGNTDAFIAEFSSSGSRTWSTYYGGNKGDVAYGIVLDKKQDIYVGGYTSSSGLATSGAYQTSFAGFRNDGFLAKFSGSGSIKWSTYYGGNTDNAIEGLRLDTTGNIYIGGITQSSSGIATSGAFQTSFTSSNGDNDAFLAKFSSSGSRLWATYYGGSGDEEGARVVTDTANNVYLMGNTSSATSIATAGAYQTSYMGGGIGAGDAFVAKFSSTGSRQWATYYGGSAEEYPGDIAIDNDANIYITGPTTSTSDIATAGAYQSSLSGSGPNVYLARFNNGGKLLWGTYYGGNNGDWSNAINTVSPGIIYITGNTYSTSGIATSGAYKTSHSGGFVPDAFIAKFDLNYLNDAGVTAVASPKGTVCAGARAVSVRIKNFGSAVMDSVKIDWTVNSKPQPTYTWTGKLKHDSTTLVTIGSYNFPPGKDTIKAWTRLPNGIKDSIPYNDSSMTVDTMLVSPTANAGGNHAICLGSGLKIGQKADSAVKYAWTSKPPGFTDTTSNPPVNPKVTTTYYLSATNTKTGCSAIDSAVITVNPLPLAKTGPDQTICIDDSVRLGSAATSGNEYTWFRKGVSVLSTSSALWVSPSTRTTYYLTETNIATGCTKTDSVTVNVISFTSSVGRSRYICYGSSTVIGMTPVAYHKYVWTSKPAGFTSSQSDPAVSPKVNTTYYLTETDTLHGCNKSDSVLVSVHPLPIINAGRDTVICSGSSLQLGVGLPAGYSYSWKSIPAGFTSSNRIVTIHSTDRTYYIVTAIDSNGCSNSDTVLIMTNPLPKAYIGAKGICPGDSLQLGADPVTGHTYHWSSLPIGFTSTLSNPVVKPTRPTTYYLTETNTITTCSKTDSSTVVINPVPEAANIGNKTICKGDKIAIGANTVSGNSYQWTSAPLGFTSNSSNPEVSPLTTTTYYLTETNASGCSKIDSLTITLNPIPQKPSAGKDQKICSGDTATLIFTPSAGMKYNWSSTLGFTSTDTIIQVHPSISTDYILTTTSRTTGCSNADTVRVTVMPLPKPAIAGQKSFCGIDTTTYSTTEHDSSTYFWTISNGKILSGQATSKLKVQWTDTGYSVISVQETNSNGCQKSDSLHIEVHPKPRGSFVPYQSCAGNSVQFMDSLKQGFSYTWDFGDGTILKDQLPVHAYAKAGNYRLKETVQNAVGCEDTLSKSITIYPVPKNVQILAQHDTGRTYQFRASDTTYAAYTWSFGDGDSSVEKFPLHTFTKSLPDRVKLIVDNSYHCIAEIDTTLEVSYLTDKDSISIFPNPFSDQVHIYERLKENTSLKLYIYDMLSHEILENISWTREPGVYTESFDEYGLAQAMYVVKVVINDKEVIYKKMIKLGR